MAISEMSARRNEAVQRTRGADPESPRDRVRIVWSEELPEISRVLTAWFPQEADSMWSGRKLCAGCWRLRLGTQDNSYSPHDDEGTKKRSNLTRSI